MNDKKLKIGISLRVVNAEHYEEKRDALSQEWPQFFEKLDMIPIFIPNNIVNLESYLDSIGIDGVILSGGDNIGDFPDRDQTEKNLIQFGIKNNIPVFGVCRGMQIINHFFDGTITKNSSNNHVGEPHEIKISSDKLSTKLNSQLIKVNSFHNNIIMDENIGKNLAVFARTVNDNTIEGIFHNEYKILGVMWHPERDQNKNNELILKHFFHDKTSWENLI